MNFFIPPERLSRRTLLRGVGAAMALPLLESMVPRSALAAAAARPPTRIAWVFVPNGVNREAWTPDALGAGWAPSATLKPLQALRSDVSVVRGLTLNAARPLGDGPGDHARSSAAFLTCAHPKKTDREDIQVGVSADQVAAKELAGGTRFASLELGCDQGQRAGGCDSGYACAYVSSIAWRDAATPAPHETSPRAAFDRLFGTPDQTALDAAAGRRRTTSILDAVSEDARRLSGRVGAADRRLLEAWSESVRDIEKRLARVGKEAPGAGAPPPGSRPVAHPEDFAEHQQLMYDMMLLAFRMDLTRVGTLMIAREGSNRAYPEAGVTGGHHSLSHHENEAAKIADIRRIDRFQVSQFARFIERLKNTPEGDGRLLDHCLVAYGAGIGDGNAHDHGDLPILLAGRGGGAKSGRLIQAEKETPLANLHLAMLQAGGVKAGRFADSTGVVGL